jgi:hypothetical protein
VFLYRQVYNNKQKACSSMSCALFAYCLLSVSLSESFDFLKINSISV